MKTKIVNVTPDMASILLSRNTRNRPLRRTVVDGLKAAFLRGEYVQTHQGIAFSVAGELLDGQHRLTAISELPAGSFPMTMTTDLPDDAFRVMDIGVKRTATDALQHSDRRVVELARLIALICTNKRAAVTPTLLIPIIEYVETTHAALVAFCPSAAKTWSSAPVRLAAVMSMMDSGNHDYVRSLYRAMVMADFKAMPPVAHALFRAQSNGSVRAADTRDMLGRCLVLFDPKKADRTVARVVNPGEAYARVREMFGFLLPGDTDTTTDEKKAAPITEAASSVLPSQYNSRRQAV